MTIDVGRRRTFDVLTRTVFVDIRHCEQFVSRIQEMSFGKLMIRFKFMAHP